MFDAPVDGWYAWLGVAVTSAALLGAAVGLPTTPPPDAAGVADTVDRTAATEYGARAEHPLDAAEVRIDPERVGLRSDAGTVHAPFVYGPVTPVASDEALETVLAGARPDRQYDSPDEFRRAAARARARDSRWRRVDGPLVVRHVVWEGVDVTLVGA
ncbi:MAG: hypothetical protein ABEJ43_07260 [Haloferacaceae archaeon]